MTMSPAATVNSRRTRTASLRQRAVMMEELERRVMLTSTITSVTPDAALSGVRFIAGQGLPVVNQTFYATVTEGATSVTFEFAEQTITDTTRSDGWSANFNMSSAAKVSNVIVRAYEESRLADTKILNVNMIMLPAWMNADSTDFTASFDAGDGYTFHVDVCHYFQGFDTPDSWDFYVPGISIPVIELGGLHTGFHVNSTFTLVSTPEGTVLPATDYKLNMSADVLGNRVFEDAVDPNTSSTKTYDRDFGRVSVEGSISYGFGMGPAFDNDMLLTGIGATGWIDPEVTVTFPLPKVHIPLLYLPGLLDVTLGTGVSFELAAASGAAHFLEITPTISAGGLAMQSFDLNPSLSIGISGSGGLSGLFGAGKVEATITGTLEQGLEVHYESATGWDINAPGSLDVGVSVEYSALGGLFGLSGSRDLFQWNVGSWDFILVSSGGGNSYVSNGVHTSADNSDSSLWLVAPGVSASPTESSAPQLGSALSLGKIRWSDPSGNDNGIPEGTEDVRAKLALTTVNAISHVFAVLSSSNEAIQVYSPMREWDNFAAGGTAENIGWFNLGLHCDRYDNAPFTVHVTYQQDGQQKYQDLQFTKTFPRIGENAPNFVVDHIVWNDDNVRGNDNGNNNGILESGEDSDFTIYLKNTGSADADNVQVFLASSSSPIILDMETGGCDYPDLPRNSQAVGTTRGFWVHRVPTDYVGTVPVDIIVKYGTLGEQQIIHDYPLFNVRSAKWLRVSPTTYDFGVVTPGAAVIKNVEITNIGSEDVRVSAIATSNPLDTAIEPLNVSDPWPWVIAAGQSKWIQVTTTTAGTDDGVELCREVWVTSDSRPTGKNSWTRDSIKISGLISYISRASDVATGVGPAAPDASGNRIAWNDDQGIAVYDITTGATTRIPGTAGASNPKISGNVVAWESGTAGNRDVKAWDLFRGIPVDVATSGSNEFLIGVDNTAVAFLRWDYVFPELHANSDAVGNLVVFDTLTQATTQITNYKRIGTSNDPVRSVRDGDFGGGVLAWREITWEWQGSYWHWQSTSQYPNSRRLMTWQPGGSPVELVAGETGMPSCNNGEVLWRNETAETLITNLPVTEDSWIRMRRDYSPTDLTENHGGEQSMYVYLGSEINVALMKFDLGSLPTNFVSAVSAKLHTYRNSGPDTAAAVEIQRITDVWQEDAVTAPTHPSWETRARSDDLWSDNGRGGSWIVRDLPSDLLDSLATLKSGIVLRPSQNFVNYGWKMNGEFDFCTSECDTVALRPFLEVTYTTQKRDQWFMWKSGQITQLTHDQSFSHNDPVAGTGAAIFLDDNDGAAPTHRWMYWDPDSGQTYPDGRRLLINSATPTELRADGDLVVWRDGSKIQFLTINRPDLTVGNIVVHDSLHLQSQDNSPVDVEVIVHNVSGIGATAGATVQLWNGAPGNGGVQVGGNTAIAASDLPAYAAKSVTFANLMFSEGEVQLFARVMPGEADNVSNNELSSCVLFLDSDISGPTIADLVLAESTPDGGGRMASDEQLRLTVNIADPNGVGIATYAVDGHAPSALTHGSGNTYLASLGVLAPGSHTIVVTAWDADTTPAWSQFASTTYVWNSEKMVLRYNGQRVSNDSLLNLGDVVRGTSPVLSFIVGNEGDDILTLGAFGGPAVFTPSSPRKNTLSPSDFTYFTVTPDTSTLGMISGTITLASSDPSVPAFTFPLSATIVSPDTIPPTVTINQASSQGDPTNATSIDFSVVFSESVTDFDNSDVTLSGTAGATDAVVTGSGAIYNVVVSGMTQTGTVIASIPAGAVHDATGNGNHASTSTDNSVEYEVQSVFEPEARVEGNGVEINDDDFTPSPGDHTNFGTIALGGTTVSCKFMVRNTGTAMLTTSNLTVPEGFTITESLSASIAAGGSDTFTVRLDNITKGTKSGQISFTNNDSDEDPYNFSIIGVVGGSPPIGWIDRASQQHITGWAFDADAGATSVMARIDIDGVAGQVFPASLLRPDLAAHPSIGSPNHGFVVPTPLLSPGSHSVVLYVQDSPGGAFFSVAKSTVLGQEAGAAPTGCIDVFNGNVLAGWAFDADAGSSPIMIRYQIDNNAPVVVTANVNRKDLVPYFGSANHGYRVVLPQLTGGTHTVIVHAIDPASGVAMPLGSRLASIGGVGSLPEGSVDVISTTRVAGWAMDRSVLGLGILVRIDIDGVAGSPFSANISRPDVAKYVGIPGNFGFNKSLSLSPGQHRVDVYIYDSPSQTPVLLASRIVGTAPPVGSIDVLTQARVAGWVYSAALGGGPATVRIDVDDVAGTTFIANVARMDLVPHFDGANFGYNLSSWSLASGTRLVSLVYVDSLTMESTVVVSRWVTI